MSRSRQRCIKVHQSWSKFISCKIYSTHNKRNPTQSPERTNCKQCSIQKPKEEADLPIELTCFGGMATCCLNGGDLEAISKGQEAGEVTQTCPNVHNMLTPRLLTDHVNHLCRTNITYNSLTCQSPVWDQHHC